jgi:protein phosphatase PTC1
MDYEPISDKPKNLISSGRRNKVPNRIVEGIDDKTGSSCKFKVGVCADKNARQRRKMEDGHKYVYNFIQPGGGFFAVYDGHAGSAASKWCEVHLHLILERLINDNHNYDIENRIPMQDMLNIAFQETNNGIASCRDICSGTTAAVAIYKPSAVKESDSKSAKLYVANVGDARVVLSHKGKAIRLTYDHKATDECEIDRVNQAGGIVHNERVNGILAISRAIGDEELKDLIVAQPYTSKVELSPEVNDLLIIACDGLWDVCTDQEAIDAIQPHKDDPVSASEFLVDYAIENGSSDNITVMVVRFYNELE